MRLVAQSNSEVIFFISKTIIFKRGECSNTVCAMKHSYKKLGSKIQKTYKV